MVCVTELDTGIMAALVELGTAELNDVGETGEDELVAVTQRPFAAKAVVAMAVTEVIESLMILPSTLEGCS